MMPDEYPREIKRILADLQASTIKALHVVQDAGELMARCPDLQSLAVDIQAHAIQIDRLCQAYADCRIQLYASMPANVR